MESLTQHVLGSGNGTLDELKRGFECRLLSLTPFGAFSVLPVQREMFPRWNWAVPLCEGCVLLGGGFGVTIITMAQLSWCWAGLALSWGLLSLSHCPALMRGGTADPSHPRGCSRALGIISARREKLRNWLALLSQWGVTCSLAPLVFLAVYFSPSFLFFSPSFFFGNFCQITISHSLSVIKFF